MAKKKQKKNNRHAPPQPGKMTLQDFAQSLFKERTARFQKKGSAIDPVYEGLDFDPVRMKRRISSVLSLAQEVETRYGSICPDTPGTFSLAEDWVCMNSYPVSAFDHIEKYVCTALGAAIWILDHIRDNEKTEALQEILRNAPLSDSTQLPDVWDPCHSQLLLRLMVSIINNRNADCPITEKAIRKNRAAVTRVYMDRPTAENKIDHTVPSRQLYDQILALIDPEALNRIEEQYTETYWEWLRRYFLCRELFNREEQEIRSEIDGFKDRMQALATQNALLSQSRKQVSILSNANTPGVLPAFDAGADSDPLLRLRALDYQSKMLYDKQEAFNARFNSFTREVGEFSLIPTEAIAGRYGEEIAKIWADFKMEDPYTMCMAFLSLLDRGSDLPWCYFPSVIVQSCYVSMLPWTRTRYISCCDDIWEHYDAQTDAVVPGPSGQPLPRKIKVPELDNWYQLQYHDAANSRADNRELFNLSQILYEVTGCLMPRNPARHLAALNTLSRYGINTKKANQNLLYCMALLNEAKHQSTASPFSLSQQIDCGDLPDTVDALQEQVTELRQALAQCRQSLQEAASSSGTGANQVAQLQRRIAQRDCLIHDLSGILFDSGIPTATQRTAFPYHTASYFAVFSADDSWIKSMDAKLPDVMFFRAFPKENPDVLRTAETVWIQPKGLSYNAYRRILSEAEKAEIPVRIFPFDDVVSCAELLVQADISR